MPAPRAQDAARRPRPRPQGSPQRSRPPSRRPSSGRGRPPSGRRPAPPRRPVPRRRTPGALRHWGRRLAVLVGTTLALTLLAAFPQPPTEAGQLPQPAAATSAAGTTATTLADATTRYRAALAEATDAEARARQAHAAGAAASALVTGDRATVGDYADTLYRRSADERWPLAQLSLHTPAGTADVLHAQGLAEQLSRAQDVRVAHAAAAAVRAAEHTDAARAAESAAAAARAEAATVLAGARELVAGLDPTVAAQWAALATDPTSTAQQARNTAALADWQGYLGLLSAAGITPPPAAELADTGALPDGLAPLRDAAGTPIAGVATTFTAGRVVTVLPAETVAAVSAAFAQLGRPYLVDATGFDGFSCAGLVSTAWTQAGVGLPADLAAQWSRGTPVPVGQLQVGDLVFSTDPRSGLDDVGLYLGGTSVLSASADRWQVAVRDVADLRTAVRVTVPPSAPTPPPVAATGTPATCSAPLPPPGAASGPVSGAWGGWSNGQIPRDELCTIGDGHRLRCDAAAAYNAMSAAYAAAFGSPLCITDSYRSLSAQVDAHHRKPKITAVPGTSNHGWALAVDLCGGVNVFGTAQTAWMQGNAGQYGWVHPDWAAAGGQNPEPWHWEYGSLT
ncbi:NlpC/P60 family protein [Modestobacter versicolor]|uniref:NlpC/P60 family protein n=1 Tax=Modestobacter versicolor TaxID=429133 RepID=UPI0034E02AB0